MNTRVRGVAVAGLVALISASPAAAHSGTGLAGGFVSGFVHPLVGFDHLLAMISVGLWGAFLGRPLIHTLPVIFPAMMVVGATMGMLGVPLPPLEMGIAVSVIVLGSCIALSVKAPVWAAIPIVAMFAIFHGHAHGVELPSAADPIGYSAGFVLATGLLHLLGIGIGLLNQVPRGVFITRSIGGIIAAVGAWFLHQALSLDATLAIAGSRGDLLKALPCALLLLPAVWIANRRMPIAVKVVASWIIVIAALAAMLPLLPVTPGYLPDHME